MPGASRCNDDTAGGTIRALQTLVTLKGEPWAVVGSPVDSHAPCPLPASHCNATMAQGSNLVTIKGVPVCRAGDLASCGHAATGQSWILCS